MKKTLITLFLITLYTIISAQVVYEKVYAELYLDSLGKVFTTDVYTCDLYSNAIYNDGTGKELMNGFFINYTFVCESNTQIDTVYNQFTKNETGVVRLNIWDNKLYGYCMVSGIKKSPAGVIVTVRGIKNTPNRKNLLFKDSLIKRMWTYPWKGN